MPKLIVPANVAPCCVDDFPESCERSKEGAIYIRPASALTVTQAELEHLKKAQPDLMRRCIEAKPKASLAERVRKLAKPGADQAIKKKEQAVSDKRKARAEAYRKPEADASLKAAAERAKEKAELAKLSGRARRQKLAELSAKKSGLSAPSPSPAPSAPSKEKALPEDSKKPGSKK